MQSWLPRLERKLEVCSEHAHQDFRCYVNAEPPGFSYQKNIPESLLQGCIKISNEAPSDIKSNIERAWAPFDQARLEESSMPVEFRACLFGLCFFHGVMLGRKRFGQQGWSRGYGFNMGDLSICADVLQNYLEENGGVVPWEDLRYIFGEIMYGGHITDFWDRKTNNTYLEVSFHDGLLKQAELGHGFNSPDPQTCTTAAGYLKHLDTLPAESPLIYGLHMNSEIAYLNNATSSLLSTILRLKAGGGGGGGSGGGNISAIIEELEGKLPPLFDMIDLNDKAQPIIKGKDGPYIVVLLQEAGRMNVLTGEIARSLDELRKGLLGQLNMSQKMEDLLSALAIKQVPGRNPFHTASWEKFAWPSMKGLQDWFADLILRCGQLTEWCAIDGLQTPISVWFPGLFNPTAFLTGIKQVTARLNSLALDKMATETHVTAFNGPEECGERLPEGMYIHGLFCEGAQWGECENEKFDYVEDSTVQCAGILRESKPKELLPPMPIIYVKAVQVQPSWDPQSVGYIRPEPDLYNCPVYLTTFRGPTWVFVATLKTDKPASHWVLRGVALVAQLD
jgi:dynein heavy chain|tara:strand:- start:19 stop:1707 length:1689 start_codon:yes stop_codon:yes gene_type:complete